MSAYPVLDESNYDEAKKEWTHNCGTILLAAPVRHSIHNGVGPLGGFGDVHTEKVPYCPTCQTKPSPYGPPLRDNPVDVSEREILRRMRENSRRP